MAIMTEHGIKLDSYEVRDYGVDHAQYFQGAGVAFTEYDEVFLGVGDTLAEAFEDACDNAASSGWDVTDVDYYTAADNSSAHDSCDEEEHDECEMYRHVGLFVRQAIA